MQIANPTNSNSEGENRGNRRVTSILFIVFLFLLALIFAKQK